MKTSQLNVKIETELINRAKAEAYSKGIKLYEFVSSVLREKINQSSKSSSTNDFSE